MKWEGYIALVYFEVLPQHLPGETEEKHKTT
jgi:hypothetical protein